MTELILDIVSWVLLGTGSVFIVIGGIGLLRMPDFFTRLHPAGITDTMGAGLILLGLMVQAGFSLISLKLFLIMAFLFITSPTTTHTTARAALAAGLKPLLAPEPDKKDD